MAASVCVAAGSKAKYIASTEAVKLFVTKPSMRIGLGSGTTVVFVAKALNTINARSQQSDSSIHTAPISISSCVPTSYQSKELIVENNLPLQSLDQVANSSLHLTIDGADEIARCKGGGFVAIKGGGGCLLQEKVIAAASDSLVLVVKSSKMSQYLGQSWSKGIPIEVLPMAQSFVSRKIMSDLGGVCALRMATAKMGPVVTDNGNFLLDWKFPPSIEYKGRQLNGHAQNGAEILKNTKQQQNGCHDQIDWAKVDQVLHSIPGLIETGLFVNMASAIVSADDDGNHEVYYAS